jgi:hypothetical protein
MALDLEKAHTMLATTRRTPLDAVTAAVRAVTWADVFPFCYMFSAIYIMNLFNVYAYRHLPATAALPDVSQQWFPNGGQLRTVSAYMDVLNPTNFVAFVLTPVSVLLAALGCYVPALNVPTRRSCRKLLIIYSTLLLVRTLCFTVTTLPPPCAGTPECPCATTTFDEAAGGRSTLSVALEYTFAAGVGHHTVPQCGDLCPSGHSIYVLCWALFVEEVCAPTRTRQFPHRLRKPPALTAFRILRRWSVRLAIVAVSTIPIVRNHYTLDVVVAVVFTLLGWAVWTGWEANNGPISVGSSVASAYNERVSVSPALSPMLSSAIPQVKQLLDGKEDIQELFAISPPVFPAALDAGRTELPEAPTLAARAVGRFFAWSMTVRPYK